MEISEGVCRVRTSVAHCASLRAREIVERKFKGLFQRKAICTSSFIRTTSTLVSSESTLVDGQ